MLRRLRTPVSSIAKGLGGDSHCLVNRTMTDAPKLTRRLPGSGHKAGRSARFRQIINRPSPWWGRRVDARPGRGGLTAQEQAAHRPGTHDDVQCGLRQNHMTRSTFSVCKEESCPHGDLATTFATLGSCPEPRHPSPACPSRRRPGTPATTCRLSGREASCSGRHGSCSPCSETTGGGARNHCPRRRLQRYHQRP